MKIVFVHDALVFDGTWWWHRMVEPLAALGLGSRAVELPSCVALPVPPAETLEDMHADADAVRAALDEEDGPVVLVGHSYGVLLGTFAQPALKLGVEELGLRESVDARCVPHMDDAQLLSSVHSLA